MVTYQTNPFKFSPLGSWDSINTLSNLPTYEKSAFQPKASIPIPNSLPATRSCYQQPNLGTGAQPANTYGIYVWARTPWFSTGF